MKKYLLLLLAALGCGCATPPLYRPAERGDIVKVRALLDAGADPNANKASYAHLTALHMAALNSRLDVAKLLIERGADVNYVAYSAFPKVVDGTPLHFAACAGANAIVQLLLERGADPDPGPGRCYRDTSLGETSPLSLAEGMGHTVAAQIIRGAIASRLGLTTGNARNASEYGPLVGALLKDYKGEGRTIAVTGFSLPDGRASTDGTIVAERVTTELIKQKRLTVVERKAIDKVLSELKLQLSGINADSTRKLGKMLGADLLVVGTVTELTENRLELNMRLASVESGEAINAASGQVVRDWLK
ncbi:MAG TPA: FlgO family outer membrane protein [Elusimicrobiales bacterium]|nr:FlgO family outer membrane protein [Elusimicrobiales bacterium]